MAAVWAPSLNDVLNVLDILNNHLKMDIKPTKKRKTAAEGFPWSRGQDMIVLCVYEQCKRNAQAIANKLVELQVDPCPTYNQIRMRLKTGAFKTSSLLLGGNWISL